MNNISCKIIRKTATKEKQKIPIKKYKLNLNVLESNEFEINCQRLLNLLEFEEPLLSEIILHYYWNDQISYSRLVDKYDRTE